ncbi:unnamed protein product [Schistocephalus solidus]|uniref:Reverse transcriptase domain-containing protein n=1 Tax=Schistocephalus solidus TaxID=70667 RepID=A0A183T786_SCHSO|nr:unnamed protein product [Schistocephalus solidus]
MGNNGLITCTPRRLLFPPPRMYDSTKPFPPLNQLSLIATPSPITTTHCVAIRATASTGTDALPNPSPVMRANSMRAGLLNRNRTLSIGCWHAIHCSDGVEFAPGRRLTDLDYADNIALLASSFGDLQSAVSRVNKTATSVALVINTGKAKLFSNCIPDQEKAPLRINGCQLEDIDRVKYLRARMLPNGSSKDDIFSRIDAAHQVFSILWKCLWTRRDLSIAKKICVYRASIRLVLLCSCESWAV